MKIAQIAPIIERVPPEKYGGTERVVHVLTEELVRRGHEVTLFATGDSLTSAKLVSTYPRALRQDIQDPCVRRTVWSTRHVGISYAMQQEFDIIHDHTSWIGAALANVSQTPTIMTLHGAFSEESKSIFSALRSPHLVSISNAQRKFAPDLNYIATVHNGLSMEHYPFSEEHDNYLLFVGRMCKEKSPHLAIKVAKALNLPLILAAKVEGREGKRYFDKYVKPHLSKKIQWIGEVSEEERNVLYSRALCFLHPISWPEPFGLTLIEAMATGCPVIALNHGSIPEIIVHGKTGFVAGSVGEMIKYVKQIDTLDRYACRMHAISKFGASKMTDNYEKAYKIVLAQKYQEYKESFININSFEESFSTL